MLNKESTPKERGFDLPAEGAYEDCQSLQNFSGVME